jgi:hypothetical protein
MPEAYQPSLPDSPGERARLVALPGGQGGRHRRPRLPTAVSSFVGRDEELSEVVRLLRAHRLVTLTRPRRQWQDPASAGRCRRVDRNLRR